MRKIISSIGGKDNYKGLAGRGGGMASSLLMNLLAVLLLGVFSAKAQAVTANIDTPPTDVTIQAGGSVNFTGTGIPSESQQSPLRFSWDFPGGNPSSSNQEDPGDVVFDTPGNFIVTFTVTEVDPQSNTVLASDSDTVTVTVEAAGLTEDEIRQGLEDIARTPPQREMARVIGTLCPRGLASEQFLSDCTDLVNATFADDTGASSALAQVTADDVSVSVDASQNSVAMQARNVGTRLAALRAGAVGLSIRGLAFNMDEQSITDQHLTSLFEAAMGEVGGAASGDSGFDFGRLGVFVNGTITFGDKDPTDNEEGFDFDTQGITAGVDYRFTENFILGAAFGYTTTDTDLDNNRGELDTDGYSGTLYGTYYHKDKFYIDGSVTYGHNDYDQERNLRYNLATQNVTVDQTFTADFDGDHWDLTLGAGYDLSWGGLTFGPVGRLEYINADVDSFREDKVSNPGQPGSGWRVEIDDQEFESFTLSLGGQASYAISQRWGVLMPQVRIEWVHEFQDNDDLVTGRFLEDTTDEAFATFLLPTDETDENYFNIGVGVSAVLPKGRSLFIHYQTVQGFEDLNHHSVNAGVRWEF